MDATERIEQFLRTIQVSNRREKVVGLLLLPIFTFFATTAPLGSLVFYAHIMILLGILFVIGMMCFVASPRGDLTSHPADDVQHWRTEMLHQAKLLRLAPLWYFSPLVPGMVLLFWSTHAPSSRPQAAPRSIKALPQRGSIAGLGLGLPQRRPRKKERRYIGRLLM